MWSRALWNTFEKTRVFVLKMSSSDNESKNEEMDEENIHSLDDVQWYIQETKEGYLPSMKEGLLTEDSDGYEVDRRIKIDFSREEYGYASYRNNCQVIATSPYGKRYGGSGVTVGDYTLTNAHNVGGWTPLKNRFSKYSKMHMYQARQGPDKWVVCNYLNKRSVHVYPDYKGRPDYGVDIALCQHTETVSRNRNTTNFQNTIEQDVKLYYADPNELSPGMTVEIAGYPGEKDKLGHPYTHTGEITAITDRRRQGGGVLIWHNVDCSGGNSGSGIMITDNEWIRKFNDRNGDCVEKVIIGLHTGYHRTDRANFGTLITPSIFEWIRTRQDKKPKKTASLTKLKCFFGLCN